MEPISQPYHPHPSLPRLDQHGYGDHYSKLGILADLILLRDALVQATQPMRCNVALTADPYLVVYLCQVQMRTQVPSVPRPGRPAPGHLGGSPHLYQPTIALQLTPSTHSPTLLARST